MTLAGCTPCPACNSQPSSYALPFCGRGIAAIEVWMVPAQLGERIVRDSSGQEDRYRGDHGPDANSAGSPGGRAPRPRRSGQSSDYYPSIAVAVNRLEQSTAETRRAIYDRARAAMAAQLRSLTPILNESDIHREQAALEQAIRKLETESLEHAAPQPVRATGDELAFVKKLVPDLSVELEFLQREIRLRDTRGSLMISRTRNLVPLTIMGLLVLTASGAY
jgi:hypothetical protein